MVPQPPCYIGFADGASYYVPNLSSSAWAIYTTSHVLFHSSGICVGAATNNQDEYNVVIGLLADALQLYIRHLCVYLYYKLLIMQLNNIYYVRNPCLFRQYLLVKHLVG